MNNPKIEGVRWTGSEVAKSKSEDDFVKLHMKDTNTYKRLPKALKEGTLRTVYQVCVPKVEKPVKEDKKPTKTEVVE